MKRRTLFKATLAASASGASVIGSSQAAPVSASGAAQQFDSSNIRNYRPDMRYRLMGKTGVVVSALGIGMLRLPMLADKKTVDETQSIGMLRHAIDCGINYVDTARGYLGGQSETVVGKALSGGYRDKVHLATKLTLQAMKSEADFDRMFDLSRKTLDTDVIDFYLLHHVTHRTWNEAAVPFKVLDKVAKLKAEGKIKHVGFSFHDNLSFFKAVLDAYDWDFCQLMQNYLDTEYEAGLLGMKYAFERGMAVNCMEPLKAGLLVRPPKRVQKVLDKAPVKRTPVQWAFDYLWDMPEPGVVISGMSNIAQVDENVSYARLSSINMLSYEERMVIGEAALKYRDIPDMPPCTGCNACAPCPKWVALGSLIGQMWFIYKATGNKNALRYYNNVPWPRGGNADTCDGCGACVPKCPNHINIPELIKEIRAEVSRLNRKA